MFIKLIFICLFVFSFTLKASELTIIELHKNKSLDQLVLENENNTDNKSLEENFDKNDSGNDSIEVLDTLENDNSQNNQDSLDETINIENADSEVVTVITEENIFSTDEIIIQYLLPTINEIKSKSLSREFVKILSNSKSKNQKNDNDKFYFIIKKLYEIGEIQKAYSLIKEINLELISNDEHLVLYMVIELNYLLSTFQLSEACELKEVL